MAAIILYRFCSKLVTSTFQASACGLKSNRDGLNEYRMLIKGDYSGIHTPVTFKQEYGKKLTDILGSLGLSAHKIKRAIVAPENLKDFRFYETVTLNNGQRIKMFQDISEAQDWLLEE